MIYCVKIGSTDFDLDEFGEFEKMFRYCENAFGFKGVAWDKIKHEYNLELLGEIFEILDISFAMYDDE